MNTRPKIGCKPIATNRTTDVKAGVNQLAAALDALPPTAFVGRAEVAVRQGLFHWQVGDVTAAQRLLEDQLHLLAAVRPEPTATLALGALHLATVALHQGNYAATLSLSEMSAVRYRQLATGGARRWR